MTGKAEKTWTGVTGAWMVHLLTASGAVFGLLAIHAAANHAYVPALWWMIVTCAIDGVDGALARWRKVTFFLPHFDGALLDNMVDYFTYVIVPAFFLMHTELVAQEWQLPLAALIILVSAYQFCQEDAKTADHTFAGFPSYWNVAVFYLFMMGWPQWINAALLVLCAAGVFIPVRYLYPSRTPLLRPVSVTLGVLWAGILIVALLRYPEGHKTLVLLSFFYIAYYLGFSVWLTTRRALAKA